MAATWFDLGIHDENCVCCCVAYESFAEKIKIFPEPAEKECVCRQCSGGATITCYEHKAPQPKGDEKEQPRERDEACPCGVCVGSAIFDDNPVEFEDGLEREKLCCQCMECRGTSACWGQTAWENPYLQKLKDETENLMIEAGAKIEKMGADLQEVNVEILPDKKFYQNQEHEAYENNW